MILNFRPVRTLAASITFALVGTFALSAAPPPQSPDVPKLSGKEAEQANGLFQAMMEARYSGRFADALVPGEALLEILTASSEGWLAPDGKSRWWQVVDQDNYVKDLRNWKDLPTGEKETLVVGLRQMFDTGDLFRRGQQEEALTALGTAKETLGKVLPPDHLLLITCESNIASVLGSLRRFDEARAKFAETLPKVIAKLGPFHPDSLLCMESLAMYERGAANLVGAEQLFMRALEGRRAVEPVGSVALADLAYNLAALKMQGGELADAEAQFRYALDAYAATSSESLGEALAWNDLAETLIRAGRPREGLACHGKALELRRQLLVSPHYLIGASLYNLGHAHLQIGEFETAVANLEESRAIYREAFEEPSDYEGLVLTSLANVMLETGQDEAALGFATDALALRSSVLGAPHPEVQLCRLTLAKTLSAAGRYGEAERIQRDVVARLTESFDELDDRVIGARMELATGLMIQGRRMDAKSEFRSLLAALDVVFEGEHPKYFVVLNGLAAVERSLGNFKRAAELYGQARDVAETYFPSSATDRARTLNNEGLVLRATGNATLAVEKFSAARALLEEAGLSSSSLWGTLTINEGQARLESGDNDRAGDLISKGGEHLARLLGADHPAAIQADVAGARVERLRGAYESAATVLDAALTRLSTQRGRVGGGDVGRAEFLASVRYSDLSAYCAHDWIKSGSSIKAFNVAERGRSRALLEILQRRSSQSDLTPALKSTQAAVAALAEAKTQVIQAEAKLASMVEWESRSGSAVEAELEKQLAHTQSARQALAAAAATVDVELLETYPLASPTEMKSVAQALRPGEIMLAYTGGSDCLVLLILEGSSDDSAPTCEGFVLANSWEATDEIRSLTARCLTQWAGRHGAIRSGIVAVDSSNDPADALAASHQLFRQLVPASVWERIRTATGITIIADTVLRDLPFECLVTAPAESLDRAVFVLDVCPPVRHLDSASALVLLESRAAELRERVTDTEPTAVMLGGASFRRTSVADTSSAVDVKEASAGHRGDEKEGFEEWSSMDEIGLFGAELKTLPWTRTEVEVSGRMLAKAGWSVSKLTGEDASLPELEKQVHGARLLHLASHGLIGNEARPEDTAIALAGTPSVRGPLASFLDLGRVLTVWRELIPECNLVCLSACETQKGAAFGDTALTLPLGFHAAGVPTVIGSLWLVDDEYASRLMTLFYEEYCARECAAPAEALWAAKRRLRALHPEPFAWAPFQLNGAR